MELCRRTVMVVGDIVNIWIYIASLGSAEQLLCAVTSSVTAFSAACDTVPPHTQTSDTQQLSLNSTNGTWHFPFTQHEHQTSHMWTTMRKYIVHTIGIVHHRWVCLMTLSTATIVQHWCQLNEAWVWSTVGMIMTWENWGTAYSEKNSSQVLHCSPWISPGPARYWTWASTVRGWWLTAPALALTAWAMALTKMQDK